MTTCIFIKILIRSICACLLVIYSQGARSDYEAENPGDTSNGRIVFWLGVAAVLLLVCV